MEPETETVTTAGWNLLDTPKLYGPGRDDGGPCYSNTWVDWENGTEAPIETLKINEVVEYGYNC